MPSTNSQSSVDSERIAEGMFEFFKSSDFILKEQPMMHTQCEAQAIAIIKALIADDVSVWDVADLPSRQTATALLVDFMAKLMMPAPGGWSGRVWRVTAADAVAQAKQAIGLEIARSHPQQSRPQ